MNFNKKKELLDGFLEFLCKFAGEENIEAPEVKEEGTQEEVKEDEKYELVEGGFIFVKEDGTVYFEDEAKTVEPNTEYELIGNKILVTDSEGKLAEIKEKEVVEEELPKEAPVELEETVEENVVEEVEDVKPETVEVTIDGTTFNVPVEVSEAIKSVIEKKENEIVELNSKLSKLESMIPTVSPVGIEINKKNSETQEKRTYTLRDFVND